ncbi:MULTISPECIES: M16 family metallopeptidase [unclassified Moraxella]|uniref:M16 family metallopeptidase n=1 Tax=unclassified Moraxella TaxID=2685852 RepID=UPI00359EA29E
MTQRLSSLWLSLLISIMGTAHANEHQNAERIDFSKPLPVLDSLKQVQEKQFTLPKFERFTTDGGIPVIFTQLDGLPMVDISVDFQAGSAFDRQVRTDALGVANMTANLLTKGAGELDEEAFLLAKDRLGIHLNAGATKDTLGISLRSLNQNKTLYDALSLLQKMLSQPKFDASTLEREKSELISSLKQHEQNPSYLAARAYQQALYQDHPYATLTTGDIQTVKTLSVNDIRNFRDKFLIAQNAVITITGNLSQAEAKNIANQIGASLPSGQKAPMLPSPTKATAKHIHVPHDSTQTSIIMGHLAPKVARTQADFLQKTHFSLANTALAGGSFNARLMDEIREKRGYTYGIYGRNVAMNVAGHYQISFSTNASQAKDAIKATRAVIDDAITNGILSDELNLVANQHTYQHPMSFASNASIHALATTMNIHGLPDIYANGEIDRIKQASLDDVNQALRQTIRPDDFIIVTVGQDKPDLSDVLKTNLNNQ